MTGPVPAPLRSIERATGLLIGAEQGVPALADRASATPREALEQAVLRALLRPPCVVSFSGGRDSSAVLALAAHVAAREGLPPPVPVSLLFPLVETAQESEWQAAVVRHLGLTAWERLAFTHEMDVVGPIAAEVIHRHGVLWPMNVHFHDPIMRRAAGGSVLTGVGGDEVMLPSWWVRANQVRTRQVSPRPRDLLHLLAVSGPGWLRRARFRAEIPPVDMPWLATGVDRAFRRALIADHAQEPTRWDRWVRQAWWRSRARTVGAHSLGLLAADADVLLVQPLQDAGFLAAIADQQGPGGFRSRTRAMSALVGDLLPDRVLGRASKSYFDEVFWERHSRELAQRWTGDGIDERIVDADRLAAEWSRDDADPRTFLLLQGVLAQSLRSRRPPPPRVEPPTVLRTSEERPPSALPTFFLVGAAKSGTSSLHSALRQHPDVRFGRVKEPHYFAYLAAPDLVGDVYPDREQAHVEYRALYEGTAGTPQVGDASTSSLVVPGTAEAIASQVPDARIIVVLRDPVERAFSHFVHFLAAGAETTDDFLVAVREEERRQAEGMPFTYAYTRWSRYGEQLTPFLEQFGEDRVLVLLHEDVVRDPPRAHRDVFAFLDVDPSFRPLAVPRLNEGLVPRWPTLHAALMGTTPAAEAAARALPAAVRRRVRTRLEPRLLHRPAMPPGARREVLARLAPDVSVLEQVLGRDLSTWKAA